MAMLPDVRTWGSTVDERRLPYPCDRHLPVFDDAVYRAVDVAAPPAILFRWLCQLRVAPYSYDWIDNLGRQSPRRLIAGLDQLRVGQHMMGFELVEFEHDRHMTLHGTFGYFGTYAVTYLIIPAAAGCRLAVKLLMAYPRPIVLHYLFASLGPPADFVMMRKQLLTLKELAERDTATAQCSPPGSVSQRAATNQTLIAP